MGDKQRWLPAGAGQGEQKPAQHRAATLPGTQRGRTGAGSPPPPQLAAGAGREDVQAGKADLPRREGRADRSSRSWGCRAEPPLPSSTLAQEQHRCGQPQG